MSSIRFAFTFAAGALAAALLAPSGRADAAHLYAVIVIDKAVGSDAEKDRDHVQALLRQGIGEQYMTIKVLEKDKANQAELLRYFRNLSVAKEDTVFCFVSCHGATERATKEHVLQLTGGGAAEFVRRSELRDAMHATRAHLDILITDACSDYLTLPERQDTRITFKAPTGTTILPAYQRLFFDAHGTVDVNASYEGTFAFSDDEDGGLFTRALYQYFQDADVRKDPEANWPKLCVGVQVQTNETFGKWKKRVIDELTTKGLWDPDKNEDHRLLDRQATQAPQVYYTPGVRLGLKAQGTDGHGVKVIDMTLDSPARASGVRVGDVIVGVDGDGVKTSDDWDRIIDPALAGGRAAFKFRVIRAGGDTEDVPVSLVPR